MLWVFASLKTATIYIYMKNLNEMSERYGMTDSDLHQEFCCCLAKLTAMINEILD